MWFGQWRYFHQQANNQFVQCWHAILSEWHRALELDLQWQQRRHFGFMRSVASRAQSNRVVASNGYEECHDDCYGPDKRSRYEPPHNARPRYRRPHLY